MSDHLQEARNMIDHAGAKLEGDPFRIMALVEAQNLLAAALSADVAAMRQQGGSWTTVGAAVGISRQAAHERWGTGGGVSAGPSD